MNERLIAFGCSHTYGQGLEDCWDANEHKPGPEPSKFAWPSLLAHKINRICINKANPGSSNLEILFHVLNFDFLPGDLVIVLWTTELRSCLFQELNGNVDIIQLGAWKNYDKADIVSWLKTYDDYNLKLQSLFHIHHAEQYLKNKNLTNYSFFSNTNIFTSPKFLEISNGVREHLHPLIFDSDKALDGGHPGKIAHRQIAEFMYNKII